MANLKATAVNRPKTKWERPVQDEWGLYDPEQAGMRATLRALGGMLAGASPAVVEAREEDTIDTRPRRVGITS